jgi:probable HAF family extracellular repeat protein
MIPRMNRLAALLAVLLLVGAPMASAAQEPRYAIQELGTLGGNTVALNVNDSGWVVGGSNLDLLSFHAFLWLPEPALGLPAGIHDLGTLGGDFSSAAAIDSEGRIVGSSTLTPSVFDHRPLLWEQGTMTDLGVPEPGLNGAAAAINDVGDVAGSVGALGCSPVLWLPEARYGLPAGYSELPTIPGQAEGEARDINDFGQVVGSVTSGCDTPNVGSHPYLWLPEPAFGLAAGPHDLLAGVPNDGSLNIALAINSAGEIAGVRLEDAILLEPWIWRQGVFEPLPLPPGSASASPSDLNDLGQVVGASGIESVEPFRALLWENGEVLDLNDLIPPGSGWTLESATAINERGQIVGRGRLGGEIRAFLLTPAGSVLEVPTLGSIGTALLALLLAAAGAALLARRRPAPRPR